MIFAPVMSKDVKISRAKTTNTKIVEVKPKSQTVLTEKTRQGEKLSIAINHAKWEAAAKWAKHKGLRFRVVTEDDIFHNGKRKG